jgi:hypothetical protein
MKIIENTPILSEKGELSPVDQIKATLKYGSDWLPEINAQKTVIACFEKVMDNKYTLLRNIRLPGLEVDIPLILLGPTGISVLYATPLRGMYRTKGEEWGTLEGYKFTPARNNLITRTARLGRAVQTYLEREGFPPSTTPVEAVLLATDPGLYIDGVRPIIRVILRDALEHFAVSTVQGRTVFDTKTIREILARLTKTPSTKPEQTEVPAASKTPTSPFTQQTNNLDLDTLRGTTAGKPPVVSDAQFPISEVPAISTASLPPEIVARKKRRSFSIGQWVFLIALIIVESIVVVMFFFLFFAK